MSRFCTRSSRRVSILHRSSFVLRLPRHSFHLLISQIRKVFEELLRYSPDLIMLMCGNNDFPDTPELEPWLQNRMNRYFFERLRVYQCLYLWLRELSDR